MSKSDEKPDSGRKTKNTGSRFTRELWGVVFLAMGLLVLISLISFFAITPRTFSARISAPPFPAVSCTCSVRRLRFSFRSA